MAYDNLFVFRWGMPATVHALSLECKRIILTCIKHRRTNDPLSLICAESRRARAALPIAGRRSMISEKGGRARSCRMR
jgi:hypothetical protein